MSMREFHHAYFGGAALVLAWLFVFDWPPLRVLDNWVVWRALYLTNTAPWILFVFGIWMIADDFYQHWRQRWQIDEWDEFDTRPFPMETLYKSPVHRLYVYLFGGLHRRVKGWFER